MPEPGRRAWAAQVPVIRFGLMGGENEADRLGRFEPYRALIERTFERARRGCSRPSDYAGVMQAFGAKQLELAALGPSAYAGAWLDTNGGVEPLDHRAAGRTAPSPTSSVLVVRADSGITTLEQMRGKSLAWADPNSASGYLIPRFAAAPRRASAWNPASSSAAPASPAGMSRPWSRCCSASTTAR